MTGVPVPIEVAPSEIAIACAGWTAPGGDAGRAARSGTLANPRPEVAVGR